MATVQNIRDSLQLYLTKTMSDYVVNTTDMAILAMNNARKTAEKLHDFTCARVEAAVVVDVYSGTYMDSAWETDDPDSSMRLRSIRNAFLSSDNNVRRPLVYRLKDTLVRTIQDQDAEQYFDQEVRYPSDSASFGRYTDLIKSGNKLYIYPGGLTVGTEVTVYLDGYRWMLDYDADDLTYEDWFTQNGADFLMWQSIVELNHLAKEFVPREEGNLTPPVQLAQSALQNLINTDAADENDNTEWEQW